MARVIIRPKRFESKKIFRLSPNSTAKFIFPRSLISFQGSKRKGEKERLLKTIENMIIAIDHSEELSELIEECIREMVEVLEAPVNILDDLKKALREKKAPNLYALQNQRKELIFRTRLLCAMRSVLKYHRLEKRFAEWHRESPPNNFLFCRRNLIAAAV